MTDARPFRPSAQSAWDRAVEDRAHIATVLQETLRAEGVEAAVIPSEDGIYPPYVRVQAWMADRPTDRRQTLRSVVDFVVDAKPYHRAPVVRTMKLAYGPKKLELKQRPNLGDADVAAWTRHALGRAPRPASYKPWRDALLAFASIFRIARAPHVNKLEKRYRPTWLTAERAILLLAIGCVCLAAVTMVTDDGGLAALVLCLLAVVCLALMAFIFRSRVVAVDAPAQPTATAPRRLVEVDEWHAVATGLAEHTGNFAKHVGLAIERAARGSDIGMAYMAETVHHVTPNGYEARPRYVLKRGQAEVHLDIYGFGDDLFVGWNANLNWLQWGETQPVSKRKAGLVVTHHVALAPGFYTPTQLDLIDLNCLTELVHRCVKKELEALLKAAAIDQQIDFEITRGDRGRALDRKQHGTSAEERGEDRWTDIMKSYARWSGGADTQSMRSAVTTPLPPASGDAGFRAALAVVAMWVALDGAMTAVGVPTYGSAAARSLAIGIISAVAAGLPLAVGARIFTKLSIARCATIFLGTVVLRLALSYGWTSAFAWWVYESGIAWRQVSGSLQIGLAAIFVLSSLVPLMVVLPSYRRIGRVLLCLAMAVAFVPLAWYLSQKIGFTREAYTMLFGARSALLMGLLGYWLPRR